MNRDLTRFERSSGLVSGGLKINRKVVGFLQSFLQSGLQLKRRGPPELEILAGLTMSGRLDSNQRPPEPHLGELVRFLPQIPVDSPPYAIIRIAPIAEKGTFPTFFAASCCKGISPLNAAR
jgi:hypothetical protein